MKTMIAATGLAAVLASVTLGCADRRAGTTDPLAPSRPSFDATTPFNNAGACLGNDAVSWFQLVLGLNENSTASDLNCTANDLEVSAVRATEILINGVWMPVESQVTCTVGDPVTLHLVGTISSAAPERFDAGVWLATDGGNAVTGSCNHYNIPVSPLPPGASNSDNDSCGNVSAGASPDIDLGVVTVTCAAGPSGSVEISACVAWAATTLDQRECPVSTIGGADGYRAGTLPTSVARCNCQSVVITAGQPTTGRIVIIKDADPDDAQDFSFTTTGTGLSSFSLDDDGGTDPTLSNTASFAGLAPGTYTVTEGVVPGVDVTSVACSTGGTGNAATRTATIELIAGANVTCTFVNRKRATVQVNKVENGQLPLTRAWAFEIRSGASTSTAGTVRATGSADVNTGVVTFACSPTPNPACTNDNGVARLVPGVYQVCEVGMPVGYANNIASPPGFTPSGAAPEGTANGTECTDITLGAGASGVPTGVPDPINNIPPPPPASGGSIALQNGSFSLVGPALSGNFSIRNSSGGSQQVFVTSIAIVSATFRDGATLVNATAAGCVFTPVPVLIAAGGSQDIALTGCTVTPPVRKELQFTVRATLNGGDQPFYERTYKVRVQ